MKFQVLDVVRTEKGTVAVIEDVAKDGRVSLLLPPRSRQKRAWYDPEELTFVASLKDCAGIYLNYLVRQAGMRY